jgi:putative transposase
MPVELEQTEKVDQVVAAAAAAAVEPEEARRQRLPRPGELKEHEIREMAIRYRLVCLMKGGRSAAEAVAHLAETEPGFSRSARWAQKVFRGYEIDGPEALVDGRRVNKSGRRVMTPQVKSIALAWWYARPAAGYTAIHKKVVEECRNFGLKPPDEDTLRKFLKGRPEYDRLVREGKIKLWDKQGRPHGEYNITTRGNERWQTDHTRLDIWVREYVKGRRVNGEWVEAHWEPREVWLYVMLDAHTRAVAGIILTTQHPTSWTVAQLLRHAILPKTKAHEKGWFIRGVPGELQCDRGADIMAHTVSATLAYLHIVRKPDPPYYPNAKGKIERFFLTIDQGCLQLLPGHMGAVGTTEGAARKQLSFLLTRAELEVEIVKWIVDEYHAREHSSTGRAPADHWAETAVIAEDVDERFLDHCLLRSSRNYTVRRLGVRFKYKHDGRELGGWYWFPELMDAYRQEVFVRHNPENEDSVLVFGADPTGRCLGEAHLLGRDDSKYKIDDVLSHAKGFRRGLVARQRDRMAERLRLDQKRARLAELEEKSRAVAEELPAAQTPEPSPEEAELLRTAEQIADELDQIDKGEA